MKIQINNKKTSLATFAERVTITLDEFSGKSCRIVERPKYCLTVYYYGKTIDETESLLKIGEDGEILCVRCKNC